MSQKETFQSLAREEYVHIDNPLTSTNGHRKIMQLIRIISGFSKRIRKGKSSKNITLAVIINMDYSHYFIAQEIISLVSFSQMHLTI